MLHLKEFRVKLESKKKFPGRIIHYLFETTLVFMKLSELLGKLIFYFSRIVWLHQQNFHFDRNTGHYEIHLWRLRTFLIFHNFLKVVQQVLRHLVYPIFICKNPTSSHLKWKENFIKHQKVWCYWEVDCLQIILMVFMSLLRAKFVRNSHIWARTYFFFLKDSLKQISNSFNTKFWNHLKDPKSRY